MNTGFLKLLLVLLPLNLWALPQCDIQSDVTAFKFPPGLEADLWLGIGGVGEFGSYPGGVIVQGTHLEFASKEEVLVLPVFRGNTLLLLTRTKRGVGVYSLDTKNRELKKEVDYELSEKFHNKKFTSPLVDALSVGSFLFLQTNFVTYRISVWEIVMVGPEKWQKLNVCGQIVASLPLGYYQRPTALHYYKNSLLPTLPLTRTGGKVSSVVLGVQCAIEALSENTNVLRLKRLDNFSRYNSQNLFSVGHTLKSRRITGDAPGTETYLSVIESNSSGMTTFSHLLHGDSDLKLKDVPIAASFWGDKDHFDKGVYVRSSGGIVYVERGRPLCEMASQSIGTSIFLESVSPNTSGGETITIRFLDSNNSARQIRFRRD